MADSVGHDQATVLEVPVTIQGAKHVDGSEQRQIFTETTKTTIVFGNGAVVNLSAKVAQGQCVFLRNEQTGREILCKVLEWRQVAESGYADLEFTTREPKFWDTPAASAPVVLPAVVPAPPVAVVAPRSVEALDMLPASAPAPTSAPIVAASAGAPTSEGNAAASTENAAAGAGEPSTHHTAVEVEDAEEALAESESDAENEAERNDAKDAELLAKLIATDPKRKPKRESVRAETNESEFAARSEGAAGHGEASADATSERETEAAGECKATLVAKLTPLGHKLHRLTYGKVAMGVGIAASLLIVVALGLAWHSHHAATLRKNRAAAAIAQTKKNAMVATAPSMPATAAAGKSGVETEVPAHGNNSGATPAQAAQKIQQQTGTPGVGVVVANNVSASGASSGISSSTPSVLPSAEASYAPKLEAHETVAGVTEQETPEQAKRRHAKSGETIPARIVAQPPPAIPRWAKGLDTDGVVKVDALIDEKGNLRSTKALSGPRVLQHEAERAVALWIFEPALTDGKPTATHMVLTVQFQR
jgi:outer membrane biosynthesis protein TonB